MKRRHDDTLTECEAAGVSFRPMGAETTGAWAPESLEVWKQLAKATAMKQGRDIAAVLTEIIQSLAVTIRRANAKALLRRSGA